ncbi:MAG: hypothetical protein HC786_24410 [Richelia sp. CSU_2_1]|nr:hypothetical protein [Microcoleus sp. SU_5_6]NJR25075.1 hypothetical protein [Richelia sp. CSU_2_1]
MSFVSEILHQCKLGVVRGVRAGLFNLFAALKIVGEPAPTEWSIVVQYVGCTVFSHQDAPPI